MLGQGIFWEVAVRVSRQSQSRQGAKGENIQRPRADDESWHVEVLVPTEEHDSTF